MNLSDYATIRSVLSRHGFRFTKSLGQNFLIDPDVCPRMALECEASGKTGVLEIGPGVGVLTAELAARAEKVVSVELDKRLLPVLAETLSPYSNVKIVQGDVLKLDLKQLIRDEFGDKTIKVCANLPYYITSPVLLRLLEEKLPVSSVTVMVQKEAAQRFCADPGTRACGAVSAAVRYYADPEIRFQVPRSSFYPQPNVDSAVIQLKVREKPPVSVKSERAFFRTVKAAFCQRRKTVLNSVSAGLSLPKEQVSAALKNSGIPPAARAEQLTLEQLARLSDEFTDKKDQLL